MRKKDWKWFGNAGHFICGSDCRFHLCTQVGNYLISTVGQYLPSRVSREIHAKVYDPEWLLENGHLRGDDFDQAYMKKFGYESIGCDRTFETMVFRAGKPCDAKECGCGLPELEGLELDFEPANNAGNATKNHMKLCEKWSRNRSLKAKRK